MPLVGPNRFEDVNTHDARMIRGGIKENDVVGAGAGDDAQEIGHKAAVGI